MWSVERTARMSPLDAQQRVLFPVCNHTDTTSQQLARALLFGICTGVTLLTPDDARACRLVGTALQNACAKNPLLSRSHFAVVIETGPQWTAEQLRERVQSGLQHMQLTTLDMLLLRAQTLALSTTCSTYERKCVVLRFWEHMVALQQSGLVAQIGLSGFSTQLTEFIFNAQPQNPPIATALWVSMTPSADAHTHDDQHGRAYRTDTLASAVAFAHGRGMDVLLHFPIRALETLSGAARERWKRLTHAIAHAHREQSFQFPTTHEADTELFEMETQTMASTTALQTPLQIAVRYLLQKGLVVVPSAAPTPASWTSTTPDESLNDAVFEHDECHELFHALLHPFTALVPPHSPNELHSSVLSREHVDALDQTLALSVHSWSPAPPLTASASTRSSTSSSSSNT